MDKSPLYQHAINKKYRVIHILAIANCNDYMLQYFHIKTGRRFVSNHSKCPFSVCSKTHLNFTSEYNLNTKPLEMDLLIVKKEKDVEIKNEIGKIFRKHNIVEYKSPDDSMNLNTYMKVIAYACLYKAYEKQVDDITLDEITITMVRERKPEKLFHWFNESGYQIEEVFNGIKEEGSMCEALRKFFEPELNEAIENTKRDIILNALKAGNSVVDISKVMLIPEKEIEAIAEANG